MTRPMLGDVTSDMVEDSIYLELKQEEGVLRRLPGGEGIPRTPVR